MFLSEAVDEIRGIMVKRRAPAGGNLWAVILKQIRHANCIDGDHFNAAEEVIRSFIGRLSDKTAVSLWRKTETGMADDREDTELFPDSVRMNLKAELLEAVTSLASQESQEEI